MLFQPKTSRQYWLFKIAVHVGIVGRYKCHCQRLTYRPEVAQVADRWLQVAARRHTGGGSRFHGNWLPTHLTWTTSSTLARSTSSTLARSSRCGRAHTSKSSLINLSSYFLICEFNVRCENWGPRFEYCNRYWSFQSPVSLHHSGLASSYLFSITGY